MKNWVKILIFCATSILFIGCDRITKDMAKTQLMYREPISYFHDTFRLEYVENTGAALSVGDSLPKAVSFWLLSMVPLAFLLALFFYVIRKLNEFTLHKLFSFALIIAGGLGNVIDRILYDRHVSDFMNMGIFNLRTGIFNVADVCVTAGVIGLLISYNSKGLLKPDHI
jgi:signal peptidase II